MHHARVAMCGRSERIYRYRVGRRHRDASIRIGMCFVNKQMQYARCGERMKLTGSEIELLQRKAFSIDQRLRDVDFCLLFGMNSEGRKWGGLFNWIYW